MNQFILIAASALVYIPTAIWWNNRLLKQAEDEKLVELSGTAAYEAAKSLIGVSLPPMSDEFHFAKQGVPAAYRIQFEAQPTDIQDFFKRLGVDKEFKESGAHCAGTFQSAISFDVKWWNLQNVQSCAIRLYKSERLYYTIMVDETSNSYWKVYLEII